MSQNLPSTAGPSAAVIGATAVLAAAAAVAVVYAVRRPQTATKGGGDASTSASGPSAAPTSSSSSPQEEAAEAAELTSQQVNDITQAVNMGSAMRLKGNSYLAAGRVEEAMACYQDTLDFLAHVPHAVPEVARTRQVVAANLLHCLVKKRLFFEGTVLASDLLEDPATAHLMPTELRAKVIYRRAMCAVGMGQREAALSDLRAADALSEGKNAEITKELARLSE